MQIIDTVTTKLNRKIEVGAADDGQGVFMRLSHPQNMVAPLGALMTVKEAAKVRDALNSFLGSARRGTKKSLSPQARTVLKHLQDHGSISGVEAAAVHKVRSLPRRINDLEEAGYKIVRSTRYDTTGQRYTRYSLVA